MKQQQRRTADDHFHHTAIPQQKEVLFDELDMQDYLAEAVET